MLAGPGEIFKGYTGSMAKARESIVNEITPDDSENKRGNGNGKTSVNGNGSYSEQDIQILEGLEAVLIRPDGSVIIEDNGRGIPVEEHRQRPGLSTLEVVMTILHAGGKFGGSGYQISSGLHGVGVSVVNALSEWCQVDVKRDGRLYRQRYERGIAVTPLLDLGPAEGTGTATSFLPTLEVIETRDYNFDILAQRFREMAYLNRELTISIRDERSDREATFYFEGGLVSFVRYLNKNRSCIQARPVSTVREIDNVKVELAVQ